MEYKGLLEVIVTWFRKRAFLCYVLNLPFLTLFICIPSLKYLVCRKLSCVKSSICLQNYMYQWKCFHSRFVLIIRFKTSWCQDRCMSPLCMWQCLTQHLVGDWLVNKLTHHPPLHSNSNSLNLYVEILVTF